MDLFLLLLLQIPAIAPRLDWTINVPNAGAIALLLVIIRKAWPWGKLALAILAQHDVLVGDYCERMGIERDAFETRSLARLRVPLKTMKARAGR